MVVVSDRLFLKRFHMPKKFIFKQLHITVYLVCKVSVWRWVVVLQQVLPGDSLECILLFNSFFIIYLARLITVAS